MIKLLTDASAEAILQQVKALEGNLSNLSTTLPAFCVLSRSENV